MWGGGTTKDESWTHDSWDYDTWENISKADKLLCFGLNNDQVGYILPDNDFRSMFTENEEINACSLKSGSIITSAFESLVSSVK